MLSPAPPADENISIVVAKSLTREDADRLVDSVSDLAEEQARAVSEPAGTWRVVVVKQSVEDAEEAIGKLESAGFDATTSFQTPASDQKPASTAPSSGRTADLQPPAPIASS